MKKIYIYIYYTYNKVNKKEKLSNKIKKVEIK